MYISSFNFLWIEHCECYNARQTKLVCTIYAVDLLRDYTPTRVANENARISNQWELENWSKLEVYFISAVQKGKHVPSAENITCPCEKNVRPTNSQLATMPASFWLCHQNWFYAFYLLSIFMVNGSIYQFIFMIIESRLLFSFAGIIIDLRFYVRFELTFFSWVGHAYKQPWYI